MLEVPYIEGLTMSESYGSVLSKLGYGLER